MSGPLPATSATFRRLFTAAPFTSSWSRYLSCEALNASTKSLRSAAWPSEFAWPNQNVTTLRPSSARTSRGKLTASAAAGMAATSWRRVMVMAMNLGFLRSLAVIVDFPLVIRITKPNGDVNNEDEAGEGARQAGASPPHAAGYRARGRCFAGRGVARPEQGGDAVRAAGDADADPRGCRGARLPAEPSGTD